MTVGYSGTPLPQKLGIKPGMSMAALNSPPDLDAILGELPDGVTITRRLGGHRDLVLIFVTRQVDLAARIPSLTSAIAPNGMIWVAWPKKTSGLATDLDFGFVQQVGLDAGLVDNKTAAIDATWTSVRFVVRLADRPSWPRR